MSDRCNGIRDLEWKQSYEKYKQQKKDEEEYESIMNFYAYQNALLQSMIYKTSPPNVWDFL